MWKCPRCKQKFANKNQSHSCGNYSVERFLKAKSAHAVLLFNAFLDAYRTIGPYELHPVKTRVALLTQMRFASVNRLAVDHLVGHLVLTEMCDDRSVFFRVDNLNNRYFVHHFRLYNPADINADLKKYMKRAYAVGQRKHIQRRAAKTSQRPKRASSV